MSPPDSGAAATVDLAVVGGGLAGLLAATLLAARGRSTVLVAPERGADRRTTALLGASIEAIKRAGAWPALAGLSQPLAAIRIVDATSRLVRAPEVLFRASELGLDAFGYNIPNEPLLAELEARAAAGNVRIERSTATAVDLADDRARIALANGARIEARLVVAADGRGSTLRRAAGIEMTERDSGQAAVVCDFEHAVPHQDISTEFHTEHGPFTLVPLPGNRSALVWVTQADEADRLLQLPVAELGALIERHSNSLLGAVAVVSGVQRFPLRSAVAERLTSERLVLIGEAAHAIPPIGAQGFNLTIRDIEALEEIVGGSGDPGAAAALASYAERRRADIAARRSAVDLVNHSLLSGALPVQLIRGAGLFALSRFAPIREAAMRAGLGIPATRH